MEPVNSMYNKLRNIPYRSSQIQYLYKGIHRTPDKGQYVHITETSIHLKFPGGLESYEYSLLQKLQKPRLVFDDTHTTLYIGTNHQIHFLGTAIYNIAKQVIQPNTNSNDISSGVIMFTSVGTTSWTAPSGVSSLDYLVVAGGGGGGGGYDTGAGGGGSGGMVLTGTLSITPGASYTVIVGNGGIASITNYTNGPKETNGGNGGNSQFGSIIALGGNGGLASRSNDGTVGAGGLQQTASAAPTRGSGGGNASTTAKGSGGGGGGAGGNGTAGSSVGGGIGGSGIVSSLSGSSVEYGKGGNGARGNVATTGSSASTNTGNGGGGGGFSSGGSRIGGSGGSGIVIISY